jgi:hypothetical protein
MSHARNGVEEGHLIEEAKREYQKLYLKLTGQIKTHLNHMQKNYINQANYDNGDLSFQKPSLYLGEIGSEGKSVAEQAITTGNDYLAYSFLMFRQVSGKSAYTFEPNYIVSFLKAGTKSYNNNDLLNTFKYTKKGLEIEPFETSKEGKKTPKKEVIEILRNDKLEVEQVLKNTFSEYAHACNILKETNDYNLKVVCAFYSDHSSPDYFLELFTCLEVFNLAKNPSLCGSVIYADEDWEL